MTEKSSPVKGIIHSLGLVFGDIGTSPIYTLTVVFLLFQSSSQDNILGVLSLIVWTLITLVTVQYAWIAMNLSRRGEGGTIVLKEILLSSLTSRKMYGFVTLLAIIGVSLLIGDGVITPAISILSAVEGSLLIPGLEGLSKGSIVLISAMIAVCLFAIQSKGTDKVAGAFGPLMIIWFSSLAVFG
ncbi:MAG TPA: KUP/HAK/KT family potassium transporter, partial [Thermodesulfovibrionales bacterium]|nr:KUP/HAK/KT family potassium transporter [Thermodesulfovibrionales bacterium]